MTVDIVGTRIKELRKMRGMTLEELGKKCNATKGMLSEYESGKHPNIRRERLELIADALDVHPGYLLGYFELEEAVRMKHDFDVMHGSERESVRNLIIEASKLTDEQVDAITTIVKGMQK